MKLMNILNRFRKDEDGAVTVDWVVLTAAIVGLGIAVLSTAADGVEDLTNALDTQLSSQTIATAFTDF